MSVAVIINPVAGVRGRQPVGDRADLARQVGRSNGEAVEVSVTECAGHARELARTACARGARLVVAWGGDGTVNEVASALAFGPVPLGMVPGGSGNGLARDLGIPADPRCALEAAMRAAPRAIDAGELGGRFFANVGGIGFDAHIAAKFNDRANRRRGLIGYTLLVAGEFFRYAACRYDIFEADTTHSHRALLIVLSNGTQFGNGIRIAHRARVDDGVLDLVVVEERSRLVSACNVPRLLAGSLDRASIWSSRRIERAAIASEAPMLFHVDGEPIHGGNRLEARVLPGALRVCAGR